jgi:hypothetical protein
LRWIKSSAFQVVSPTYLTAGTSIVKVAQTLTAAVASVAVRVTARQAMGMVLAAVSPPGVTVGEIVAVVVVAAAVVTERCFWPRVNPTRGVADALHQK